MIYNITNAIRVNLEDAVDASLDEGMISEGERTDIMNFLDQFITDEETLHVR